MKESDIQKKILNWLKSEGYWAVKVIACNKNGTSDILACAPNGMFVAIEVKRKGALNNVSKLQQYQIDEIKKRNGIAFAADSLEMVEAILNVEHREYEARDARDKSL